MYPYTTHGIAQELPHVLPPNVHLRFDLVDWSRQILVDLAPLVYADIVRSFQYNQSAFLRENTLVFMDLLRDLDRVLATQRPFMLGPWLEAAKTLIPQGSPDENALFEFNARNQITLWGPSGQILDYGAKQWSGLVSHYYAPRWALFFDMLEKSLHTGKAFDQSAFASRFMSEIGLPFTLDTSPFPTQPIEDSVQVCRQIYRKWRPSLMASRRSPNKAEPHPNAIGSSHMKYP